MESNTSIDHQPYKNSNMSSEYKSAAGCFIRTVPIIAMTDQQLEKEQHQRKYHPRFYRCTSKTASRLLSD